MKRFFLFVLFIWSVFSVYAHNQDSIKVEIWLSEAASLPQDSCRILYFAKRMLGVPYVAGTLDGNDKEQLIARVDALDCTTFVETVLALAIVDKRGERDFGNFKQALTEIRYRDGILDGYASRLHYFSDWIRNNEQMGFVKEYTSTSVHCRKMPLWLDFMTTHPDSYLPMKKDTSLVASIARFEKPWQKVEVPYIPKEKLHLSSEELKIKNGDILSITTNIKGLDVVHVGFAFWKNGRLHLLHASSNIKKVIEDPQPLFEYSKNKKSHTGVRVVRLVYRMEDKRN